MKIYGIDFTSAPQPQKPIVIADATLTGDGLHIRGYQNLSTFEAFEAFLAQRGAWVAGLDFPFGQPRRLIENLPLPPNWSEYVTLIEAMGKSEWVATIKAYMNPRPPGDKLHFRHTDRLCNAQSPMKMHFIPVGRMFFQGAPRLLASDVSVPPLRPLDVPRVALEVYPALAVRELVGRGSGYKSDTPKKQTEQARSQRQTVLDGLLARCPQMYGVSLHLPEALARPPVEDASGDHLDALLCTVQAAWAYTQRDRNYGIPPTADPLEGWIVDPQLLKGHPHG